MQERAHPYSALKLAELEEQASRMSERLIVQTDHAHAVETRLQEQSAPLRALEATIRVQEQAWTQRAAHFLLRVTGRGAR